MTGKLIRYNAACKALAAAVRVDEAKDIKDRAEALRAYAQQAKNPQLEADAWEIRKRAEDKLGELSSALDKAQGQRKPLPVNGKKLKAKALKDAGISTSTANRYEQFHRLPAREKEKRIAKGRAAIESGKSVADAIIRQEDKKQRRSEREQELAEKTRIAALKLGTVLYDVILADPPWRFETYSRDTGLDRAADNHYPTMTSEEIGELKVPAAPNSVLFLWATSPILLQALGVMAAWGFTYKSHCIWLKPKRAHGFWFWNRHELLLVGTKGSIPAPAPGDQWESVIATETMGGHSEKPAHFAELIEEMFPNGTRLEMFARKPRLGWTSWGNEV